MQAVLLLSVCKVTCLSSKIRRHIRSSVIADVLDGNGLKNDGVNNTLSDVIDGSRGNGTDDLFIF